MTASAEGPDELLRDERVDVGGVPNASYVPLATLSRIAIVSRILSISELPDSRPETWAARTSPLSVESIGVA